MDSKKILLLIVSTTLILISLTSLSATTENDNIQSMKNIENTNDNLIITEITPLEGVNGANFTAVNSTIDAAGNGTEIINKISLQADDKKIIFTDETEINERVIK
ncbi:MAG: hypothetical protein Q4Q23_02435 [Methanobacteriaceae archaeon]|nr:hypothetical protein [Methanobacteriaceae archaeon]